MSTPYNNQRALARSRARWRGAAAGSGTRAEPAAPLPQEPQRQPSDVRDRPRPASGRPVRKHPRWIDRDT